MATQSSTERLVAFLQNVSLFKNIRPEFLNQIASRLEPMECAQDQNIVNEGDDGDAQVQRDVWERCASGEMTPSESSSFW